MNIRIANTNDNFEEIAELIYKTDNYIYPYWFYNFPNWKEILIGLIKSPGSVFYFKNIIVAEVKNHVVGILVKFSKDTNFQFDYSDLQIINSNFTYTLTTYLKPLTKHIADNTIYISNICVKEEYRRKGIASKLIKYLKSKHKGYAFELDVLSNNTPALKLYIKSGFKIQATKKGFNAPHKRKPKVFSMSTK